MAWLDQLRRLFETDEGELSAADSAQHPELLRVLLLLEAATADRDFADEERALIRRLLLDKYQVPPDEFDEILRLAREKRATSVDVYSFTRDISNRLSGDEREELMLELWQVMFADNHLDAEEEYLARKFQKLLKLDHQRWIRAKMSAKSKD